MNLRTWLRGKFHVLRLEFLHDLPVVPSLNPISCSAPFGHGPVAAVNVAFRSVRRGHQL